MNKQKICSNAQGSVIQHDENNLITVQNKLIQLTIQAIVSNLRELYPTSKFTVSSGIIVEQLNRDIISLLVGIITSERSFILLIQDKKLEIVTYKENSLITWLVLQRILRKYTDLLKLYP